MSIWIWFGSALDEKKHRGKKLGNQLNDDFSLTHTSSANFRTEINEFYSRKRILFAFN